MMKIQNQTREQFVSTITGKSAGKQDFFWNLQNTKQNNSYIYMGTNGDDPGKSFSLTQWALSQLCETGKVPLAFYNRCSNSLKNFIYNEHIANHNKFMRFRRICDPNNQKMDALYTIRAVMSEGYSLMDDDMLFPVVAEALATCGISQYAALEYDDHITRLLVKFADAQGTFQNMEHTAGMVVTNSETGHSAVWIEPCVFTRGYHWVNRGALREQDMKCRIVHRGDISAEKIEAMVIQAKKISQVGI